MPSRAGNRERRFKVGYGRLSSNKIRMLRTQITNLLVIQALDPAKNDEEHGIELSSEEGINYVLLIPIPGRQRPLTWNFSNMTHAELVATRQFFNRLFDLAEPITRHRDKVAEDAFEQGDDSFARVYRAIPQVVDREREVAANRKGIHDRPSDAADGHTEGINPSE